MQVKEIQSLYFELLGNVKKVMIGGEEVFTLILSALLSGGHVLLEDNPGTGKTTMAKALASSMDAKFRRVQFTPDLMPQDITGLNIFSQKDGEFHFVEGPVFTNILLADEINRATPRTQSALLQAMEEEEVTVDGKTYHLRKPFLVIATENPIETTGTFPLPEAELDRFLVKLTMGDLSSEDEVSILARFMKESPLEELSAVASSEKLVEAASSIKNVLVKKEVQEYIVNLSRATRLDSRIMTGVSPRASLSLMRMSQAFAAISGRDFVTPDDVRYLAPFVFAHRIIASTGTADLQEARALVKDVVAKVNVPTEKFQ